MRRRGGVPSFEVTSSPRFVDRAARARCRTRFSASPRALDQRPAADVALDTEADSFHHYFEKACLLQLAWDGTAYLVDPLAPLDVPALLERLAPRRLLMHGADYDLRLLFRGYGFRATSLFDTMLAAQLLGEKEIGLAALLSARAGVTLDKTHQRSDWSARPLAPPMVAYAASDVLHLAHARGVAHARPRGEGPPRLARRGVRPAGRDGLFRRA